MAEVAEGRSHGGGRGGVLSWRGPRSGSQGGEPRRGLGAAWTGRGVDGAGCGAVAVAMAEDSTSAGPGGGACSLFRRTAGKLSVDVGAPPHRVEFSG
jgi:hypothetical protein